MSDVILFSRNETFKWTSSCYGVFNTSWHVYYRRRRLCPSKIIVGWCLRYSWVYSFLDILPNHQTLDYLSTFSSIPRNISRFLETYELSCSHHTTYYSIIHGVYPACCFL